MKRQIYFMMTKSEENEQEFLLGGSSGYQVASYNSITYVSKVEFRGSVVHIFWKVFACTQKIVIFSVSTDSTTRPRRRWEDSIKIYLREIGCGIMYWIHVARDRNKCQTLVNTVIKPSGSIKCWLILE